VRAHQLTDPLSLAQLARSLRNVVARAEQGGHQLGSAVTLCTNAVNANREGLLGLAERLERPGPVNPCGVARVVLLLTDGASPLYNHAPTRTMGETLWWMADGLQPCPPHSWGCPVRDKLDPDHVAWTCARCGTIGKSTDPARVPE